MKYYKLITRDEDYGDLEMNKVFPEDFKPKEWSETIGWNAEHYPDEWQLCEEYEYYLQEGLPEKWTIYRTVQNYKDLNEWNNKQLRNGESYRCFANHSGEGDYFYSDASHTRTIREDYTEISFDTFKKLVLKQNDMKDREIIGYKLKDDCKQYIPACASIVGLNYPTAFFDNGITVQASIKIEKAGVLNLWFEPVYAEEYKVGDWYYQEEWSVRDKVFQISKIDDNGIWGKDNIGGESFCSVEKFKQCCRKATPEEVKAAQQKELYFGKVKFTIKHGNDFATTEYGNIPKSDIKKAIDYIENPPKLKGYTLSVAALTGSEERFDSLDSTYLTYTFGCTKGKLKELKDIYKAFE